MIHRVFVVLACLFLTAIASGQDVHTTPAPALGSEIPLASAELPYSEALTPPMPVSALEVPLRFTSETERSNFVMGSLQFGVGYDDNLLGTPTGQIGDASYLILPSVDISQTRERWNWDFGYRPGFTMNQRVTELNQATQALHLLFAYRLSPHVTAQVREDFAKTNSLFSGLLGTTTTAGPGPLQQPNSSVITPLAGQTQNGSGLDLTYQFGASSLVGANGNFYFINYDQPTAASGSTSGLVDTRSWGGNGFYAHRFANRHWTGFTYNFQRLMFDPGDRTDVNRLLFFYSISTGSHIVFSAWAGPEQATSYLPALRTSFAGTATSQANWNVAGGADLSWEGRRTSFRAGYLHQTTDGGGLAQAVNLQQVNGEIHQRLSARLTGSLNLSYAKNVPLNSSVSGITSYHSWIGNGGFEYRATERLSLGLQYGRNQLRYEYVLLPAVSSYRNRAWFSISYSFLRPLGR